MHPIRHLEHAEEQRRDMAEQEAFENLIEQRQHARAHPPELNGEMQYAGGGTVLPIGKGQRTTPEVAKQLKVGESEKVNATYSGRAVVIKGISYPVSDEEWRAFEVAATKAQRPTVQAFIDWTTRNYDRATAKRRLRELIQPHLPAGFRA